MALALPANIGLCRKALPGANTLAYYKKFVNYDRKYLFNLLQLRVGSHPVPRRRAEPRGRGGRKLRDAPQRFRLDEPEVDPENRPRN